MRLLLVVLLAVLVPASAEAAQFDVEDLGDADNGACNLGTCTLRDAINAANANPGADTITFATLGAGTISPTTPLPPITETVTIDGTTAAGFVGEPVIELSGASAPINSWGIDFGAGSSMSEVKGLVINGWSNGVSSGGIRILNTTSITITGNYIGTDTGGGVAEPNVTGIYTEGDGTVIGGPLASQRNVISGNSSDGIYIHEGLGQEILGNYIGTDKTGASAVPNVTGIYTDGFGSGIGLDLGRPGEGNVVSGNTVGIAISEGAGGATDIEDNRIGTDVSGTAPLANSTNGVELYDPVNLNGNLISGNGEYGVYFEQDGRAQMSDNRIGTDAAGTGALPNMQGGMEFRIEASGTVSDGDTISFNNGPGIALWSNPAPTGNSFRNLSMVGNFELGIDLGWNGVSANDPLDADSGPNGLQNFPELASAVVTTPVETLINGTFNSEPSSGYEIDFYASASCHSSGHGQGETFLATLPVNTDGSGDAAINGFDVGALPPGQKWLTATATNTTTGSTSEFSACVYAGPVTYDVNTLADAAPGDGSCDPGPGGCTLRDAIRESNLNPLVNTITFSTVSGSISPEAELPEITDPLIIDGESAPGWSPGSPVIELEGSSSDTEPGLELAAGSSPSTIQGLVMNGWQNQAIEVSAGTTDSTIRGNFIGTNLDGTAAASTPNLVGISLGGSGGVIGGAAPADRNVISANTNVGIGVFGNGPGHRIIGNYIGTDRTGSADLGNVDFAGVFISAGSAPVEVGGTAPGEGNLISGNNRGVWVQGASGSQILNNLIGTNAAGTGAIPNDQAGVRLDDDATDNVVSGGTIAFNGGDGIEAVALGTNGNTFSGLSVQSNGGLGIDLGGDGVTANDDLDGDSGPNGLQNYPVLSSALTTGSSTTVSGTLNSSPSAGFTVELFASPSCDPTGFGEGAVRLASTPVAISPSGQASFQLNVGTLPPGHDQITALATSDTNGSTSEFSACIRALPSLVPDNGRTAVTVPVSGVVKVKEPGGGFVVLSEGDSIPTGSLVDATRGRVRLVTETGNGKSTQSAVFYAGVFRFQQPKGKTLVTLTLAGGKRNVCRAKRGRASVSSTALRTAGTSARKRSRAVVRRLWGRGKGRYKTKGKRGAATVRGTHWLTADRCDGTLFRVREGVVAVNDFGKKRDTILRRGDRYLARAR